VFLLWLAAWSLAGYFSFRDGVEAANKRLPKTTERQLSGQDGLLITSPSTILVMGTDSGKGASRRGLRHSDSMLLLRTDPDHHRISYLSIPRDLWVEIPGHGTAIIRVQIGRRSPCTVRSRIADTTTSSSSICSAQLDRRHRRHRHRRASCHSLNAFDCPYNAQRCAAWDGCATRAPAYGRERSPTPQKPSRPGGRHITRGERQRQVTQGSQARRRHVLRLPWTGDDLLKPLATDLTAGELAQLGWVKFRADSGSTVRCRLGGDPETIGGSWILRSSEENRNVISMFTGDSAPQPPAPGTGTYGPGCVVGSKALGSR
jgi:hypothetical protein